ncbi:unnamed protein product [Withania somnifera]
MGSKKIVCVTGASGFVTSWLVKLLLKRGYTVNATVRYLNNTSKVAHLLSLDGANGRLHLFKSELLEYQSFDPTIDGCEGVFHTASPEELVDSAVKGTLIVTTSSISSVMCNKNMSTPGAVADDTWYSDPEFCEERKEWYQLSKTLSEKAAWKFAKENGIDLVTLHPGLVIGPFLQPTLNFSCEAIVDFIKEAFEVPSANGRCCLVGANRYSFSLLKILQKLCPSSTLPENFKDGLPLTPPHFQVSSERAKIHILQLSAKDMVESLMEKNFLHI